MKQLDYYLVQGKDDKGDTVTKPFFDGIEKPIVIINVYRKTLTIH